LIDMLKIMLDTNQYDRLLKAPVTYDRLLQLQSHGEIELLTTHIQRDEILAVDDPEKRGPLEALLGQARLIGTRGVVVGVSRIGLARLGDDKDHALIEHVRGRAWKRKTKDALIVATATKDADVLVTDDDRLIRRMKRYPGARCEAVNFEEFQTRIANLDPKKDPDLEQEARIALLQFHTSQMQGTRTHILSAAILVLAIFEIWFRMPDAIRTPLVNLFMSVVLGMVFASICFFAVRIFWYGQLVRSTVCTHRRAPIKDKPLIYQLDKDIIEDAKEEAARRGDKKLDPILKWLTRRGMHDNAYQTFLICVLIAYAIMILMLVVSPGLTFGFNDLQVPQWLAEAFRWSSSVIGSLAVLAIADRCRKPSLRIQYRPEPISKDPRRWVHVDVCNKPSSFLTRSPAFECIGSVTYTSLDGIDVKGPRETKWESRPEPESLQYDAEGKPVGRSIEIGTLQLLKVETIHPGGRPKGLDIAVKFDGENDAWIWTPESYVRYNRPECQLKEGIYRVKVRIESPGIGPVEEEFMLENKGDKAAGLRLMPASKYPRGADPR